MFSNVNPIPKPLRLSPSRVTEFNNCPALYKYRVIDRLPEPPSIDAERGTLIHTVLEDLFDSPSTSRNLEMAASLVPSRWADQKESKPELAALIPNEKEWIDRVEALLKNYFELEDPSTFDATFRELHLELNISEELYLHGYVDRLDVASTGEVRIVDYKTGKSPKAGWEEKALFQLRIYALLYWKEHGVIPKLLKLIYLGDSKLVQSAPTEKDLLAAEKLLMNTAAAMLTAIETEHFTPKPSRLCDWCYFKTICPAHNS